MQRMESPLSKSEYLYAMKSELSSPFEFFTERFTGFCFGNIFYVTYHTEYQWDRRFSNPKNAALGTVQETSEGCEIRFMTFRGLLCPGQFLMVFLLCFLACILVTWFNATSDLIPLPVTLGLSFLFVAIAAPISALFESMTDRSEEGRNTLLSILYDPKNHY